MKKYHFWRFKSWHLNKLVTGAYRDAVIARHGSFGKEKKILLTNFESAAPRAIKEVLLRNELLHKGCLFHFRKALLEKIKKLGLQSIYQVTLYAELPRDQKQTRKWLQRIMALPMVPESYIPHAWHILRLPPSEVEDQGLLEKLTKFQQYFEKTWMKGSFPIEMWCHFDHDGFRTRNHCEGFRSGIKKLLTGPHPSMSTFLNWLQRFHYSKQRRVKALDKPETKPKERRCEDILRDQKMAEKKSEFARAINSAASTWRPADFWASFFPPTLIPYLDSMAGFIGARGARKPWVFFPFEMIFRMKSACTLDWLFLKDLFVVLAELK